MPELPEVETIKRQLGEVLVGQRVKTVEVKRDKSFVGESEELVGKKIVKIGRKGKMLVVETDDTDVNLLVHLKMTGQLIYQKKSNVKNQMSKTQVKIQKFKIDFYDHKPHFQLDGRLVGGHPSASWVTALPDKYTRVVVGLEKGTLFFNDLRVFGWMKLVTSDKLQGTLRKMPPDIIDSEVTAKWFYEKVLQRSKRAVKVVVMDSQLVGGVGNIYANDGLFEAEIDPRRAASSLRRKESDKLLSSLRKVMNKGIKYGGATASDDKFVQTTGLGGKYQEHFLVYERNGEKCVRCGGEIVKLKLGGRGTYYCSVCQK
jgi:formamidopyrimidine-DNA glycosylase